MNSSFLPNDQNIFSDIKDPNDDDEIIDIILNSLYHCEDELEEQFFFNSKTFISEKRLGRIIRKMLAQNLVNKYNDDFSIYDTILEITAHGDSIVESGGWLNNLKPLQISKNFFSVNLMNKSKIEIYNTILDALIQNPSEAIHKGNLYKKILPNITEEDAKEILFDISEIPNISLFFKIIKNPEIMLGINGSTTLLKRKGGFSHLIGENDTNNKEPKNKKANTKKIFISHATTDKNIIDKIIELIEIIGVREDNIFYSSMPWYGVKLGENFLDRIKREINEEVTVISFLLHNFYNSEICLCEMGAAWVKTDKRQAILIPPFDFKDIKGVIENTTLVMKINDTYRINELKEYIEKEFNLTPINSSKWEDKKGKILNDINFLLEKQ